MDTNYKKPRFQNTTNDPARANAERTCQDILDASILPALPSDKHMPGTRPRGGGKTTAAIQSTASFLSEPGEDSDDRNQEPGEQTVAVLQPDRLGLAKALRRLTVHKTLCLSFIASTHEEILTLSVTWFLAPPSQEEVSESIINKDYKKASKLRFSTVWWAGSV